MASGEMSEEAYLHFLTEVCAAFARHSRDGSLHYLFIDWRHIGNHSYNSLIRPVEVGQLDEILHNSRIRVIVSLSFPPCTACGCER